MRKEFIIVEDEGYLQSVSEAGIENIPISQVQYIVSDPDGTLFYDDSNKGHLIKYKLGVTCSKFKNPDFVAISRFCYVNMNFIKKIWKRRKETTLRQIDMKNGAELFCSRNFFPLFNEEFNRFKMTHYKKLITRKKIRYFDHSGKYTY